MWWKCIDSAPEHSSLVMPSSGTQKMCRACSVPHCPFCCPTLSFLLCTGASCMVTRRQNIRKLGFLCPTKPCPQDEFVLGKQQCQMREQQGLIDGWGHSCSRTWKDAGCGPNTAHVARKDGPYWSSPEKH